MSFRVARVAGVPVRVHITSAITFLLLSYLIGLGFIARADSSLSAVSALVGGAAAAFLLFACIVLHEYGHVLCARRFGMEARSVDLFLLGGEAKLTCTAGAWRQEMAVALAGPAVSVALAAVFGAPLLLLQPGSTTQIIAFYLMLANALIAVANLVPAYPLDGGRVFHAALWAVLRDRVRAARVAAFVGEAMGLGAAAVGSYVLLTAGVDGLWLILLGWYVFDAAARSRMEEEAHRRLRQAGVSPQCSA